MNYDNQSVIYLLACLDRQRSRTAINEDIKELQRAVRKIRILGTLARGDTRNELNQMIRQMEGGLRQIRLEARMDRRQLNREINTALRNVSAREIDLNLTSNGERFNAHVRRAISQVRAFVQQNPISVNLEPKKENLIRKLSDFTENNTKINESSYWLGEADRLRELIGSVSNVDELQNATDQLRVFTNGVQETGYATVSTADKIKGMFRGIAKVAEYFDLAAFGIEKFKQSLNTLKENDTILTEISKTSEMTQKQLEEIGKEAFQVANQYGQLSSNYLLGVQAMNQAGYGEMSQELAELSLLAQSAGAVSAESANNYLLAVDAAYQYGGSVQKLNDALDGANEVSKRYHTSLCDIFDAVSISASAAADAGVTIEELTAAESAMIAATGRNGAEIGRAFRAIIMNLQQVSGEFDGEVIDEESIKRAEERCRSLGIELVSMKDGVATLRNPMEILKELAEAYQSLPDNRAEKQSLVSDIGGEENANALSALFSQWDVYDSMLGAYASGTGSALEAANQTADSWAGRLVQLQNSWDHFVSTITDQSSVKGGISFLTSMIQAFEKLADRIGAIPVLLTTVNAAMAAYKKDYGISQIYDKNSQKIDIQGSFMGIDITAYKKQQKHFREAESAISEWNNRPRGGNMNIDEFENPTVQNHRSLKDYLRGVSAGEPATLEGYKASLIQAGEVTDVLRLKTMLLTSVMSMGFGLALQGVITVITKLANHEKELIQSTKEATNVYKEAVTSIDDYIARYAELRNALLEARGSEEETYNVKKQMLELQTELNETFGEEYGKINLITNTNKDQTEAIKRYNKELANTYLNENEEGIRKATKEMESEKHYNLSVPGISAYTDQGKILKELARKYKDQGVYLLDEIGNGDYDLFSVHLKADPQSAYDTINAFETELRNIANDLGDESLFDDVFDIASASLNQAKDTIETYGESYNQALMAQIATDDKLSKGYNDAVQAVEEYNEAVLRSESPFGDEAVEKAYQNLQTVKQKIEAGGVEWEKYSGIMGDVFASANDDLYTFYQVMEDDSSVSKLAHELKGLSDTDLQAMSGEGDNPFDQLYASAEEYGIEVQELIDLLVQLGYVQSDIQQMGREVLPKHSDFVFSVAKVEELFAGFDQLKKIYLNISEGSLDWSSILNNDEFDKIFGPFTNEYNKFVETVSNMPDDIAGCQSAFDDLATVYLNHSDAMKNLTPESKQATIAMLEQMGVMNAEEVVTAHLAAQEAELAAQKEISAIESINLAAATWQDIAALIGEGEVSHATAGYLAELALSKIDVNNNPINSKSDIDNIIAIANAAGASKGYIDSLRIALVNLQNAQTEVKNVEQEENLTALKTAKLGAAKVIENNAANDVNKIFDDIEKHVNDNKIDPTQFYANKDHEEDDNVRKAPAAVGPSSKATPEKEPTIETFNFIETLISRIQEAISKLKEKAEEAFSSFTSRGKAYAQTLQKVTDEINIQQRAYDAYLARANSYGLDESWASQVRDGSINIADVTDDNLKEQIKQYKDWYEKARECQEQIQELQKTQKELAREKIELLVTKYDKLLSKLKSASDRMQDNISFKETWGGSGSKKNYADMNKNAKSQITYLIKQSKELKNLQKTVAKGSEAWYEYNERIESNNASIRELTQTMAENAIASASLAKTKAEKKNEKEDDEDKRIDARLDTTSDLTTKNKLISSKIYNINERQNYWKDAYATNQKDRANYGNKILKAKKKDVSKNNKKLFAAAIKSVKSKKLISTATINGIVAAMNSAKGKEYKELSTLLSYCNYYNANKNAEEETKLNYEMYALTAQSEKASLREEQLQNRLDANQTHADRSTTSLAETTAAQNRNLDVQTRQNKQNVSSYTKIRKDTTKTREKAGKNANFSSEKSYKKLKNKKLKSRLKAAIAAIKSGKKISKDALKAVKDYCSQYLNGNMTYYYNCRAYNESVENELSAKEAETLAKAEAYAAERQAKLDKAANTVSGRDSQNELYAATAQNQITASGKNAYVDKQSANIAKNLDTYRSTYKGLTTDYNKAKATVKKTSGKDKSSKKIVNDIKTKYVNKNALIPASYIEKAYQVSNSFGLACENYNEALEAKNTAKETLDLYEQTAKSEKAALAMEKMANIEQEYANKQSVYEQRAKRIDSAIDLNQAKGYQTSKVYYDKLMGEENAINQSLQTERTNLTNSLAKSLQDGSIAKYSDEWYEACAKIDAVTNAIDESNLALQEYKNQIQQMEWDNFDYLEGRIKNVASEVSFLADELSRKKLASDDLGWMTDEGNAAAALHAYNYEIYKNQAQDYKKEIDKLNAQLAKDPYNKTLLDRRDALVQSYQEVIKSTEDEKYAVIDLYKQGYNALSNKIHTLIGDYNDLLDAEKNAYDYQNTIADKTKEIAQIRKQLTAYAGDLSEETRSKVQTLKVSLENAEKELAETQYEKYISDTKDMLSEMQEDFDQSVQEIVDALAENFGQLLSDLDTKTAAAAETITSAMTGIGYMPTDEFRKLLYGEETEGNQLPSIAASAVNMLAEMQKFNTNMQAYAAAVANAIDPSSAAENGGAGSGNSGGSGGGASNNGGTTPKPNAGIVTIENPKELKPKDALAANVSEAKPSRTPTELSMQDHGKKPAKKPTPKQQADSYIKAHLSKTTSKREKLSDLNKKFYDQYGKKVLSTKEAKELAKLLDVKYDNQKSSGKLYKKLKALGVKGFKSGSNGISHDQLAFLGEGMDEIQFDKSEGVLRKVGQGDMIFDSQKARNLWNISQTAPDEIMKQQVMNNHINPAELLPEQMQNYVLSLIKQGKGNQMSSDVTVQFGDIHLPNVTDSHEFAEHVESVVRNAMCRDGNTRKCITESVATKFLGKSSVGHAQLWKR